MYTSIHRIFVNKYDNQNKEVVIVPIDGDYANNINWKTQSKLNNNKSLYIFTMNIVRLIMP